MRWTKNEAMCFRKKRYRTRLYALGVAQKLGKTLGAYQCPHCLWWHLTKRMQPGWHPFPPPKMGTFLIRDASGKEMADALIHDQGRSRFAYCVVGDATVGRVDRMAKKGFEWWQPEAGVTRES